MKGENESEPYFGGRVVLLMGQMGELREMVEMIPGFRHVCGSSRDTGQLQIIFFYITESLHFLNSLGAMITVKIQVARKSCVIPPGRNLFYQICRRSSGNLYYVMISTLSCFTLFLVSPFYFFVISSGTRKC